MDTEMSTKIPQGFITFIERKLEKNSEGGRPNFVHALTEDHDPLNEILNIVELAWIKGKSYGQVAKKYKTSYHTIWRLLQELEPLKKQLVTYLQSTPRRKRFYNPATKSSDYETVATYIRRARRDGLKKHEYMLSLAEKCWKYLNYKDPANWTADEVNEFIATQKDGAQYNFIVAIRQIAPQIADPHSSEYLGTGRFKAKIRRRKKEIFGAEIKLMLEALDAKGLTFEKLIFQLHLTCGAREGSKNPKSGLCGLTWDRFKKHFTRVDIYESKVKGGIWWRGCPVDLFFRDLPNQLRTLWKERGKPTSEKLIRGGYLELLDIYKRIRQAISEYYKDKLEPSLYKELTDLRPHDANKIHCNLLWEAEVPLEVVCGEYLGGSEGIGLVGRGWLDTNVVKTHYLSLTQHSERFKQVRAQITNYAKQFNGHYKEPEGRKLYVNQPVFLNVHRVCAHTHISSCLQPLGLHT
jgi:hypothetical protein